MSSLWKNRLRHLAAALGLATLGGLGLTIILSAAHDAAGAQAAAGASTVIGTALLGTIAVLAFESLWTDSPPKS